MTDPLSLAGSPPFPVRRADTISAVCRLVSEARSNGQAVYPVGGRTMLDLGFAPQKPGFALDLTPLNAVVDYPARDMTITVQAGITVAKLQEALSRENQWLPVDVPLPERATLGGAIATNASGSHRYGYGTLRDYVIGIQFVTDEAVEVKGGGRVVKNVAGYDFMKLQTGALGTLGIITQVTLKLKPKPEATAVVAFGCASADLAAILEQLHQSNSRPVALELLNRSAWQALEIPELKIAGDWILAVGFEEKTVTVNWQRSALLAELKSCRANDVADSPYLWQRFADLQVRPESTFISKASVRPSLVAETMVRANNTGVLLHAQPLNGILWQHSASQPSAEWSVRRGKVSRAEPNAESALMKRVKSLLDPNEIFNPGRLLG